MEGKKAKLLIVSFLVFLFVFLSSFHFVFSQEKQLEVEYPEIGGIKPETVTTDLREYAKYLFVFGISIIGLIAFGVLVYTGIIYLTSAGQPARLKEARDRALSAFLGIIILASSYIILYTINPQLVSFPSFIFAPPKEKPISLPTPLKAEESSLISLEIPLGQAFEKRLWSEERRANLENFIAENKNFLSQEIKSDNSNVFTIIPGINLPLTILSVGIGQEATPTFNRISDLNKYLKVLTEECRCEELKGLCTKPKNFSQPVGCSGDPCPKETRKKIEKVLEINQEKQKEFSEFQKKIIETRTDWEKQLSILIGVEQEVSSCEQQSKSSVPLNEYLARLNYFEKYGWKSEIITIPNAPKSSADPITFYCPVGGTLLKYPYPLEGKEKEEILPLEFLRPDLFREKIKNQTISCPVEFPIGEIIDEGRELAGILIVKLDELNDLYGRMIAKIEKMRELISQCNDKNCKMNCGCIPNPCYRCCTVIPCYICAKFCKSPCLQAVGGCAGFCPVAMIEELNKKIEDCLKKNCLPEEMEKLSSEVKDCSDACPRPQIIFTVGEIKAIEDEIFNTIKEIEQIYPKAASLIYDEENPVNLRNVRTGMSLCYSSLAEDPTWTLLSCDEAIGNYGPTGQIIGTCHPRNFFCCMFSETEKQLVFPWKAPPSRSEELILNLPVQKYEPLTATMGGEEKNCPEGWRCSNDVKNYNQYQDASEPLKKLLACTRQGLDSIQEEKEINGPSIGRITSISDKMLSLGKCKWETGPSQPPCSHTYGLSSNLEPTVSCHYGGVLCRYEQESYAIDFGARLPFDNYEDVKKAVKECEPRAFIDVHGSGENLHLHVSIGGIRDERIGLKGCGCDDSRK